MSSQLNVHGFAVDKVLVENVETGLIAFFFFFFYIEVQLKPDVFVDLLSVHLICVQIFLFKLICPVLELPRGLHWAFRTWTCSVLCVSDCVNRLKICQCMKNVTVH